MGVLRWPADPGADPEAAAPPPPLAHDSQQDIPIQHLRWAVAVVHGTPSLARLFPPAELEVGFPRKRPSRSIEPQSEAYLSSDIERNRMPTAPCTTRCRPRPPPPSPDCSAARVSERASDAAAAGSAGQRPITQPTGTCIYTHRALVPADGPPGALRRGERGAGLGASLRAVRPSFHPSIPTALIDNANPNS